MTPLVGTSLGTPTYAAPTANSATVTNLSAATHTFTVTALNAYGLGAVSSASTAVAVSGTTFPYAHHGDRQQPGRVLATGRSAIDAWTARAVQGVRDGSSLAGHPNEILSARVAAEDALDVGKEAFLELAAHLKGNGAAYLVVSVGAVPVSARTLGTKAAEVELRGLEAYITNQLDVAVGATPFDARYKDTEVVKAPLDVKVFGLSLKDAIAYVRGTREDVDDEWQVDAVLSIGKDQIKETRS